MECTRVARFENGEDERAMSVGVDATGGIVVVEDLRGPSTLVAYGDDHRRLRVAFDSQAARRIVAELGFSAEGEGLWSFLSDGSRDIVDLMDACDRMCIPYTFTAIGSHSGMQLRTASGLDVRA